MSHYGRRNRRLQASGSGARPAPVFGVSVVLGGTLTICCQDAGDGKAAKPHFDMDAYNGGAMRVMGWAHPVITDGRGVSLAAANLPIYLSHWEDMENLIGQTAHVKIEKATGKITASGPLTASRETSPKYAQLMDHAANGFQWQASIGASVQQYEFVDADRQVKVNGQTFTGPVYVARKVTLAHIAVVPLGADTTTRANIAAQGGQGDATMTYEQWLTAQGRKEADLSDDQNKSLRAAYESIKAAGMLPGPVEPGQTPQPANTPPAPPVHASAAPTPPGDDVAALRTARAAEHERIAAVEREAAGHPTILAQAVRDGWTVEKTQLEVLRASRVPDASGLPAIHAGSSGGPTPSGIVEASLVLKYGLVPDQRQLLASYGEQTLTAADKLRRVRLSKIVELVCAQSGTSLPLEVNDQYVRAAFSNQALTGILGNVANKALSAAFMGVNQVAPRISRAASHMNFHAHTIYSMALNGDLQEVGPRGELKHMNLSEESYTRQVKTRGAVLSISRQDLINDELGAFLDMAQRLGRKAALARERATFLALNATGAGSSFFTTAHANYISGATTTLSHASLSSAVQTLRDQTGPDGDPVGIEPKILLVPTALEVTARELCNPNATLIATALGSTAAAKREPQVNIWAGAFRPEVSEWLSKTIGTQAGSSTAWYLLADPADVAAVEISYLNGNQMPTIEFFGLNTDPNVLGVSWQCYWDLGVDLAEYRGGVKSKGAA